MGALGQVLGGVDDVAEHRARGREPAGASAVEHQLADRHALDEHGVEALAHRGQRVTDGHHRRVHAHGDRIVVVEPLGDAEQLDAYPRRSATAMSAALMFEMPSWYTSPATTFGPNAIVAMIAALAPASYPSTSAVGSRSANPRLCASASASA
jgi:hypothetical protein